MKLAKKLGKVGVVVGNCFGFVANRMLAYYMREAYLLLEEGASVPQIDGVLTDFGLPVGPYGMQDIAGIDVGARIRQYLESVGKTRAEGPQSDVPDRLFEMGRYGQKTGAGWYKYERRQPRADPRSADRASSPPRRPRSAASRAGTCRTTRSSRASRRRWPTKARACSRSDYATRASDIDVIYCYGFGFPRYRGGPMFYADTRRPADGARAREGVPRAVWRLLEAGAAARASRGRGRGLLRRVAAWSRSPASTCCASASARSWP